MGPILCSGNLLSTRFISVYVPQGRFYIGSSLKEHVAFDRTSWSFKRVWNCFLWKAYGIERYFKSRILWFTQLSLEIARFSFYSANFYSWLFYGVKILTPQNGRPCFFCDIKGKPLILRHCVDYYILLLNYLSNHLLAYSGKDMPLMFTQSEVKAR